MTARRSATTTRTKAKAIPAPSDWAIRGLVVLHGGPRDGWWYFADDMAEERLVNQRMGYLDQYVPTKEVAPHPVYDCTGDVWTYSERAAVAAGRRAAEEGMARAKAAHRMKFERGVELIREYALMNELVSINEMRDEFDVWDVPDSVRGSVFTTAQHRGYIRRVGVKPSSGQSAHAADIKVYRSCNFPDAAEAGA